MFGTLNTTEIEDLLKQQVLGHLGCYSEDNIYVVPISYAYDGEYIYCHSLEGVKINTMRNNPRVCFQVDKMENMANWKSVMTWGEFEELKNGEERNKALQNLMDRSLPLITSETVHLSPEWPFPSKDTRAIKGIVFRIRVKEKTGRYENSEGPFLTH